MQARVPSIEDAMSLIAVAQAEGWGDLKGEGAGEGNAVGKSG